MKSAISLLISFLIFISLYPQSDTDKNPILTDNFIIEPGIFFPSESINLKVQGSTDFDLDEVEDIDFDEISEEPPALTEDWHSTCFMDCRSTGSLSRVFPMV